MPLHHQLVRRVLRGRHLPAGHGSSACGANGAACTTCATGDTCAGGACLGCVMSCTSGCCTGSTCNPKSPSTCGTAGATCADCTPRGDTCNSSGQCACGSSVPCSTGQHCDGGQCLCDSSSCPSGCCNGTTCQLYAGQTLTQCGTNGQACAACTANLADACGNGQCRCGSGAACGAGQRCASGQCVCDSASCPSGCCTATAGGSCVAYGSQMNGQCGTGGAVCAGCGAGQRCNGSGQCVCDATTCPDGCCTATVGGTCVAYGSQTSGQCGAAGALCSACSSGQECNASGQCVCDATSCPNGCCTSAVGGTCKAYLNQSNSSCGHGGSLCAACAADQHCPTSGGNAGYCACDSTTCPAGCCTSTLGGSCVLFQAQSNGQCGIAGAVCAACGLGQHCPTSGTDVGYCLCDGVSCPGGCCTSFHSGTCIAYGSQSNSQCGAGGGTCAACAGGQRCNTASGLCQCDATSCPSGCCTTTGNGTCVAYASQSNGQCGSAGAMCGGCATGQRCNGSGQCVCDGTSCPSGCCTATVGGTCKAYASESNSSCGRAGAICAACSSGQHCATTGGNSGYCLCDSTSCPTGCCSAVIAGSCNAGTGQTACGLGGNLCANCNSQTCNSCRCVGPVGSQNCACQSTYGTEAYQCVTQACTCVATSACISC